MKLQTLAKKAVAGLQALALAVGISAGAITGLAVSAAPALAVCDVNGGIQSGADCAAPSGASNNLFSEGGIFQTIANGLIFLVGAIAVIT